jgi:hypothetical protein
LTRRPISPPMTAGAVTRVGLNTDLAGVNLEELEKEMLEVIDHCQSRYRKKEEGLRSIMGHKAQRWPSHH